MRTRRERGKSKTIVDFTILFEPPVQGGKKRHIFGTDQDQNFDFWTAQLIYL